jgi:hypothetical protein
VTPKAGCVFERGVYGESDMPDQLIIYKDAHLGQVVHAFYDFHQHVHAVYIQQDVVLVHD